jgi:hypothetical protein
MQSQLPTAIGLMPASKAHGERLSKMLTINRSERFTRLLKRQQQMDLAILIRMPMVTRTLTANGPWPEEQQSVSLSGYIMDQLKQQQQLRPELSHVPLFRLDDL